MRKRPKPSLRFQALRRLGNHVCVCCGEATPEWSSVGEPRQMPDMCLDCDLRRRVDPDRQRHRRMSMRQDREGRMAMARLGKCQLMR